MPERDSQADRGRRDAVGPLLLGATGCVGRMLVASGLLPGAVLHSRRRRPGHLSWDILSDAVPALPNVTGVVMMARGTDMTEEVALARTAAHLGHDLGVPVLIASSQAVYGVSPGPHGEDGFCRPANDYGKGKLAAEAAVAGMPGVTCLRIGNVAGADMLFRRMIDGPVTLDEIRTGQGPRRAMIGPVALARAIGELLAMPTLPPILNLAQPGLIDMADLLRAAGANWDWTPAPETALPVLALDLDRITDLIALPPATPEGLVAEARACGWGAA